MERVPDPAPPVLESLWDAEWEDNLLDAAFRRVRSKVDAKQLQIYDLCVRKRWPPSKVARDLRVGATRVYLAKHRVGNLVKKELLDLKRKPF
jgi:RNA polymerase sigma-70 factor (ECF subfamily)